MMSKENFRPPDLILKRKKRSKKSKSRRIAGICLVALTVVGASVIWKEEIIETVSKIL